MSTICHPVPNGSNRMIDWKPINQVVWVGLKSVCIYCIEYCCYLSLQKKPSVKFLKKMFIGTHVNVLKADEMTDERTINN